jgi:uncharacterized protein (DUF58 family)
VAGIAEGEPGRVLYRSVRKGARPVSPGRIRPIVTSSKQIRRARGAEVQRRLSREGTVYLGILFVLLLSAVTSGINLLVLIFGMLVGVLIANWTFVRPTLRGATATRRLPSSIFAGEPFAVEIDLANRNRHLANWSVSVEDRLEAAGTGFSPRVWFPRVAAGSTRRGVYRGILHRRGRYDLGWLKLSTSFPLGLAGAFTEQAAKDSLVVYPRPGKLSSRWSEGWEEMELSRARAVMSRSAIDEDFRSLREFRPGDSTRWIHWRTTARKGELMVREFEHPQTQDSAVLLDLWAPDGATPDELDVVERAVSFAATVCTAACRRGKGRVILAIAGRENQVVQGQASPGLSHRLLRALACAEAAPTTQAASLLEDTHRYGTTEGRCVIVGTRRLDWFQAADSPASRRLARWTRGRLVLLDASSPDFASYFQR